MNVKLGKLPAKIDSRTIKFASLLRVSKLPPIPEEYDLDAVLGIVDNRMFLNDIYGDCVIAGWAHQTMRFEKYECGEDINISDQEVKNQYFKLSGGVDSGLYMLDSLNHWREDGWIAGGKLYKIHAFASIDWKDHEQVKQAVYLLGGVCFGISVYQSDLDQFNNFQPWHMINSPGRLLGGHAVYAFAYTVFKVEGYNGIGPIIMTWGRPVQATWAWWDNRVDEAYAIIDAPNPWLGANSPINIIKLEQILSEITGEIIMGTVTFQGVVSNQAQPSEAVTIKVTSPNNTDEWVVVQTDGNGAYSVVYTAPAGVGYQAQASVAEDAEYLAAASPVVIFDMTKEARTITLSRG